jgi:signal transduction histidine kinase
MTAWFRGAAALLVIALALVTHQVRLNAVEKRNRELLALHEQREKARQELGRAYERLRWLTRRLEVAKEEERRHIARELHDEMGPTLTAVIINLQLLSKGRDPAEASGRYADTIDLVDRMIQRVRDLSLDLSPPLLDELGLVPAVRGYMEAQTERTGIDIDVGGDTDLERLPPEIEITAFRVVQEAVTNVIRHAKTQYASVTVRHRKRDLELIIEDEGVGFDVGETMERAPFGKALGLLGLQERVRSLGGEAEIVSSPDAGTRIRVLLPVEVES